VNPADDILRALPGPSQQVSLAALVALGTPGLERLLAVLSERAPLYVNSPYDFRDIESALQLALLTFARADLTSTLDAVARCGATEAVPVIWALGQIDDPALVPLLAAAATSKEAAVRWSAVYGLARQSDPRATDLLIAALGDRAAKVRNAAAERLGERGDPRAIRPLEVLAERSPRDGPRFKALIEKIRKTSTV
jgi:HEAT repeat protein